jgi:uncharacterized protein YggU (UPF0235/DUF167 family)
LRARLAVKVVARAARDEIVGWRDGRLRIRVAAAPERGRANVALEALLAESLSIPRSRVRVVAGHTAARKLVEIEGLTPADLDARLPPR